MATNAGPAITDDRKEYVLRTTCNKNGGFRFYVPLPPQRVFQKAYWVLGSELEVRIKRKTAFINRETKWTRVPVYLTTNKGLLFVYIDQQKGYILRVPCAKKLYFEGTKKPKKLPKNKIIEGSKYNYIATMQLVYSFGELHIRFDNEDNLRPWRAIMLAAHQTPQGLAKAGAQVAQEVCKSASASSVVSTKSIIPEGKNKADEICLRRYNAFPRKSVSELSVVSQESSQMSTHVNLTAAITSARASASGTSIMSNVSRLSRVSGMPITNAETEALDTVDVEDIIREKEAQARCMRLYDHINLVAKYAQSTLSSTSEREDEAVKQENEDDNEDKEDENDDITQSPVSVSAISNSTVDRGIREFNDAISVSSEVDVEVASSASTAVPPMFTVVEDDENEETVEKKASDSSIASTATAIAVAVKSDTSVHTALDPDEDRFNIFAEHASLTELPTIKKKTSVVTFAEPETTEAEEVPFLSDFKPNVASQEETAGRKPGILRPVSQNAPAIGTAPPVGASSLRNRLDFWRNQELVRGNTAPLHTKPVILGKTVQQKVKFINAKNDDHPGKVVTSPTRYFATVEDAAKAVSDDKESHI
uniref:PH domain-containing protein n=1 Tax=Panagrellus redivivus TaxID=6233 RepID=A0A7E4WAF0_PANRE